MSVFVYGTIERVFPNRKAQVRILDGKVWGRGGAEKKKREKAALDAMGEFFELPLTGDRKWWPEPDTRLLVQFELNGNEALRQEAIEWVWERDEGQQHFIHPYNFVSVPPDLSLDDVAEVPSFHRRSDVATHAKYRGDRHSGYVDCRLATKTDWFMPDSRKQAAQSDRDRHKVLGYFTLDPVNDWQPHEPAADPTTPALPAASLRGMIRSVFETATLSCFSVFDGGHLDFRVAEDLEQMSDASGNKPRYIPARVLSCEASGDLRIRLLDGRQKEHAGMRPAVVRSALVRAYDRARQEWKHLHNVASGAAVAAVIRATPELHQGYVRGKLQDKFHYYPVVFAVPVDELSNHEGDVQTKLKNADNALVFGFLHRTGKNMHNKHFERIFFDACAIYNDRSSGSIEQRRDLFQQHETELEDGRAGTPVGVCGVSREVARKTLEMLGGYADRHVDEVRNQPPPPRPEPPRGAIHLSDFVNGQEVKIEPGNLFYALIDDTRGGEVRGLYPVAVPRSTYDDARLDLLPDWFVPCSKYHLRCAACAKLGAMCETCLNRHRHLCPACRVFGWTRDLTGADAKFKAARADRVDAVAGHVRFTHGELLSDWDPQQTPPVLTPLPILGSPKPTTTQFYLRPNDPNDPTSGRESRWPPILQQKADYPFYRTDEATLRGRKFYRRRQQTDCRSWNQAAGGLRRPGGQQDSQNQTVHLLPKDMQFGFRVYFDNLTTEELGGLLFSLNLKIPDAWQTGPDAVPPKLRHSLGHGKPLGMGACEIEITKLQLDSLAAADDGHRYAAVPSFLPPQSLREANTDRPSVGDGDRYIQAFGQAWAAWEQASPHGDGLRKVRDELTTMMSAKPPDGPLHYPMKYDKHFPNLVIPYENFSWFKQRNQPLHDPAEEADDEGRLPYNPKTP